MIKYKPLYYGIGSWIILLVVFLGVMIGGVIKGDVSGITRFMDIAGIFGSIALVIGIFLKIELE